MPCTYFPTLSSYHDGELPPAHAADVVAHVASCETCAAELKTLRRISAVFGDAESVALSPIGRARILGGILAGERNRQIAAVARPFAAAASLILAIGLPLLLTQPVQSSTSAATAGMGGAPVWETALLARDGETATSSSSQEQLAEWVATDLTRK